LLRELLLKSFGIRLCEAKSINRIAPLTARPIFGAKISGGMEILK